MSCAHPLLAVDRGYRFNENGVQVRDIQILSDFSKINGHGIEHLKSIHGDNLLLLPCGHCYSCCLDYSRMWASRIMLETQCHQHNCFLTLTYSDGFVPNKLEKRPFQLFMKRLRKELGFPVRYFACGEVGDGKGSRGYNPHYHICLFGYDFPDKRFLKRSSSGLIIYRSPLLEKLWPFGMSSIGDVSPESAQYVAKYSMKRKLSGYDYGEFVLMSRRPGIGASKYDPSDYLTDKLYISGKRFKIPRYFDKLTERFDPVFYSQVKDKRISIGRTLTSKKFLFCLDTEEEALSKADSDRISLDSFKRRYI